MARRRIGPGMFGLLGPNGAGKTTLMRVLAVQAVLGYLPQAMLMTEKTLCLAKFRRAILTALFIMAIPPCKA